MAKPVLNHFSPINGTLPIAITNLDGILAHITTDHLTWFSFELKCKFKFQNTIHNNQHYQNNIWITRPFTYDSIDAEYDTIYIKLPLFLLSYLFEYQISLIQYTSNGTPNSDSESDNEQQSVTPSDIYIADIPSILIESTYNIGDDVTYQIENASFVRSGKILEFLENDMIKINTHSCYTHVTQPIVTIHSSKVDRDMIEMNFVLDLTNKTAAIKHLILRNDNSDLINIYDILCESLLEFYYFDIAFNGKHCSRLFSMYICSYLYSLNRYEYKIGCIYDDTDLYIDHQWKFKIFKTYNDIKKCIQTKPVQLLPSLTGYSCDIC
eukprot:205656_1